MIFTLKDLQLHYEIRGAGTPLLMLHGQPTDRRVMISAFEPIFAERTGWQRIYVDLPGMGATTGGSWIDSNEKVVEVLLQFMDTAFSEQTFAVAGFSYGGYLTRGILHQRATQTVGALLLVPSMNPYAKRVLPETITYFGNDTEAFEQFPAPFNDMFKNLTVVHEAEIIAKNAEFLAAIQTADQAMLGQITANYELPYLLEASPADYQRPMLILTGRQDSVTGFTTATDWQKQFPRATFATLDRAGHGLHLEQTALFRALVHDWLDRVEEDMA